MSHTAHPTNEKHRVGVSPRASTPDPGLRTPDYFRRNSPGPVRYRLNKDRLRLAGRLSASGHHTGPTAGHVDMDAKLGENPHDDMIHYIVDRARVVIESRHGRGDHDAHAG